jgi:tetratricopeptide (TPR) repeat protein
MPSAPVFISHASSDDAFVRELRQALEGFNIPVWVDSRNLRGGNALAPAIAEAIAQARHVLVVLSPQTINSSWVRREIRQALVIQQQRQAEGYRVIPMLLPGIEPTALESWFEEEPLAVPISLTVTGLSEALPAILAALGERLPDDRQPVAKVAASPVEDLLLELRDPHLHMLEGKRQVTATATLTYTPASSTTRPVESRRFTFTAPLGPIEMDELRWYLERFYVWPTGVFQKRATRLEAQLPQWGEQLYRAVTSTPSAQEALHAWQHAADGAERRFSVLVDGDLPEGSDSEAQAVAREAATVLLALPWELLHDGRSDLFQGQHAVRVRRRLPNRYAQRPTVTNLPIRILLVSPRPENAHTGYIDHRISALPLVEAVERLGKLAELTMLTPPTLPALQQALQRAAAANTPFDVVHFDGHGVYDRLHGLGGLCFEDPRDQQKLHERDMAFVDAKAMAALVRAHRIPLVFLEACQSAQAEVDPTASVAAKLLEEGVTSVVAMSHSVLVETARRFVQTFYARLAEGARVGQAMLAGQQALYGDTYRGKIMGAGELRLRDWFVPVLYQEEDDPQLITALWPEAVRSMQAQQRRLRLGALPEPPSHQFQGRSRDLLALERLLHDQPYAVIRGQGGMGKTTLAVELARWLVRTGRFQRAAFVSLEVVSEARAVLDSLGRQLLPEGANWSVAQFPDLRQALQPAQRALAEYPTLIVLDNLESVLPDATGATPLAPVAELFEVCQELLRAHHATRLLFTSREALPAPFAQRRSDRVLEALERDDAIALVAQVLADEGVTPLASDAGRTPQEITDLVEAVNRHPRALVLLAQEVARRGVRATTETLRELMAVLHTRHPDDREQSLFASVELSLRRLAPEVRVQLQPLAVFHGGANIGVWMHMLGAEVETVRRLAQAVIGVGLGTYMDHGHLRLDPALAPYLLRELPQAEQASLRARWAEGMALLVGFLYQQLSQNTTLAAQLTLLELPNLLAWLGRSQEHEPPEQVVDHADRVERLLALLGRPDALARATAVREQAARALTGWSHASFITASSQVDRLLERGDLPGAHRSAQAILQRCLAAGDTVYPEAAYDLAMAHLRLGLTLKAGGTAEAALPLLATAQQRFEALGAAGNASASTMASVAITERGDCLRALGRLEEAATAYEEAIERDEARSDQRSIAVGKAQLGTVCLLQQRYDDALVAYQAARDLFTTLGEPGSVATIWHQIGMVHRHARQFNQAEHAYRQALTLDVQQQHRAGEAGTLVELGILYDVMGRLEEAVTFHRQATDIHTTLGNLINEGRARNNLANTLLHLQRYDDARRELQRAIACKEPFGHAAEPWTAWGILHDLEQATGNPQAAIAAWQHAVQRYLAYRHDGGESQEPVAELCAHIADALRQGDTTEVTQLLTQLSAAADLPPWLQTILPKLQAILHGDRNPALADDPALAYRDAAELLLLLEQLAEP